MKHILREAIDETERIERSWYLLKERIENCKNRHFSALSVEKKTTQMIISIWQVLQDILSTEEYPNNKKTEKNGYKGFCLKTASKRVKKLVKFIKKNLPADIKAEIKDFSKIKGETFSEKLDNLKNSTLEIYSSADNKISLN